jgi:hypothetical protein
MPAPGPPATPPMPDGEPDKTGRMDRLARMVTERDSRSHAAYPRELKRSRFRYATVPRGTSKVCESRGSAASAGMITFGTALTARVAARPRRRRRAAAAGKSATGTI